MSDVDEDEEMYNQGVQNEDILYDVGDLGVTRDDGVFVKGKDCSDCLKSLIT